MKRMNEINGVEPKRVSNMGVQEQSAGQLKAGIDALRDAVQKLQDSGEIPAAGLERILKKSPR